MDQPYTGAGLVFYCGVFFFIVSWGGELLWRASPFENYFCNWNRFSLDEATVKLLITSQFCFGWYIVESGTSIVWVQVATAVFFVLQMYHPSTVVGPIFYWGGFSLTFSWWVNSSEGHPPLKTIFAIEIDALLMKQLWSFWFQVNSGLVGPWWSLAHQ